MSTRYMKRVYGDDILGGKENEAESDQENNIVENVTSKSFNVFDVLDKNSDKEEEDDNEEERDKEEQDVEETSTEDANQKKKRKKKKRKKRLEEFRNQVPYGERGVNLEDEIERMVEEVNNLLGEPVPSCSTQQMESTEFTEQKSKEDVLMVQHKYLNPYNELKKIFGSKTVQAEQSNRRNRGRTGHIKRTRLVFFKENWVPTKFGLSMSLDNTMERTGGVQYFVYEHSQFYREIQLKFLAAVESFNPENILSIINAHPYHVDALLQVAEICKIRLEDLPMAAKYTERALYCLECGFHPLFDVTTARCRLDYRKQQNRTLFVALFRHIGFIGGRACYRTSLEFCKLLLSLDPEGDPLAVVLTIDFYALRAKEYEWFIEFCSFWDSTRNLTQLPNIAYSLALAHFHLGHEEIADELLQNALIMFPGVLMPLLDKCSIQADDKVLSHDFFNGNALSTTTPALETLQNLYVARSFHVWKEPEILPWLKEMAHVVLGRVESDDEYVKYSKIKRSKRYQGKLPKNVLRNIVLSEMEDIATDIYEGQNDGSVLSHDPLPPTDSIDIYKLPTANTVTSSNVLSLFFSSLFTNINADATVRAFEAVNGFYENNEQG